MAETGCDLIIAARFMRKWILQIHLYGALLCAGPLIIFGFTSLHFNHQFEFAKPADAKVTWEQALHMELVHDDLKAAESVRDALGLMGWLPRQKMHRDREGNLRFDLERPGRSYTIHALLKEGRVEVQERRKGFWPVFNALHGMMGVPNSKFSELWGWYKEFCVWFVLFAAVSGIYLWASSARERRAGLWILSGATAASLGLILYVVLRG